MESAWVFDVIRIYYQCGFVTALLFIILSQGEIEIKDIVMLIMFWPAPLLIMFFNLKGGDDQ